jgi:hypothetical protein
VEVVKDVVPGRIWIVRLRATNDPELREYERLSSNAADRIRVAGTEFDRDRIVWAQ